MVETLAKWMATSEKWLKNKNGMGVTVKRFTKKEGMFFFELDVPEKYSRFTEKLHLFPINERNRPRRHRIQ